MTPAERPKFVQVLLAFAELKGKELTAEAIELYWRALHRWPLEDFQAAAVHLLRTCEWMPQPFHFEQLRRAGKPTAGEAWARVLAHSKGPYRDGSGIDDGGPIDQAVGQLGGYRALAFRNVEYLSIDERRFAELYGELLDVTAARDAVPSIAAEARVRVGAPQRAGRIAHVLDVGEREQ